MTPEQREVLSLATDDYTGAWEVAAIVADAHPELDEIDIAQAARDLVRELVDRGAVELFIGEWVGELDTEPAGGEGPPRRPRERSRPVRRVVDAEVLGDLSHYSRPPINSLLLFVVATSKGEEAYFGRADL